VFLVLWLLTCYGVATVDVGLSFVVRFCVGSTSWCTGYSFQFGERVFSACSWRFLIWFGLSVPVPCYSAWESAVTVLAMVAAHVLVVGVLGFCKKSHACIAARERATCSCLRILTSSTARLARPTSFSHRVRSDKVMANTNSGLVNKWRS